MMRIFQARVGCGEPEAALLSIGCTYFVLDSKLWLHLHVCARPAQEPYEVRPVLPLQRMQLVGAGQRLCRAGGSLERLRAGGAGGGGRLGAAVPTVGVTCAGTSTGKVKRE